VSRVWNSTIERHTPLRQGKPLARVNPARKKKLHEKQFGNYAELVRSLPCVVCDRSPCDPHHVRSRGAGGDKSDLCPLCRRCHALLHTMGRESFEHRFQLDLEAEAATLWAEYGDG